MSITGTRKSGLDESPTSKINLPMMISVLGVAFVMGTVPAGLLPANVANIERAYGLTHDQMGRLIGLCMLLGGCTGGSLGGWLTGKLGAIRIVLFSLVLCASALCCIGLGRSFPFVVIGLWGYFCAAGFLGSSNTLATYMMPDRQKGIVLAHASNATGKLAAPVLASIFLLAAWRTSFVVIAAVTLSLLIPALIVNGSGERHIGKSRTGGARAPLFFWFAMSGFALIAGSEIAVALWVPSYSREVCGFSDRGANSVLLVFLAGMVAGRLIASAASAHVPARRAILLCGLSVLFVAPALMFRSYAGVLVGFALFGLAFSATWPSYFSYLTHAFPDRVGLMGGTAVLWTQCGFAACSCVSGMLARVNPAYALLFGAAVMGVFVIGFFAGPVGSLVKE